jgi:hypothetical protein
MLEPGTQIGRYEIQRRLGRGGMGTVYVAHDPVLGRMVAIKVFAGDLDIPDARDRFSREARSAAALNHPNIVTVYDFGEYSSQPFIVMEYVPGETIAALIRRKAPASTADKLRWMEELCAGAGYAHRMSVIHRDIKPANLMIDRAGRLKILDFGIARMMGTASNTIAMIGTPGYMSPEQIQGDAIDHRSDLFSVGVVLYELLSYTEPFPGDTMPTIVHRVLSDAPVSLAKLVPDLGPDIVEVVDRLLQKKASDRFEDAEAVRAAIARVRRSLESSPGFSPAPTVVRRDTPPGAGSGGRGTGSARSGAGDAVGVAQLTPPPDPRRTDREALARRRTEQLNAALELARVRLGVGDLDGALDACQQALTFDENHPDALALEQAITAAVDARPAAASAAAPPAAATEVDKAIAEAAHAATVLAPRRTPRPSNPAPIEVPERPATQPAATQPASVPPAAKLQPATAVKRPAPAARGRTAPRREWPVPDIGAKVRHIVSTVRTSAAAQPKQARLYLFAASGILLAAVLAAVLLLVPAGVAPTGTLVIDAAPWGIIQAIESDTGERRPLPSAVETPLSLALPAGSYQVVIAGPSPDAAPQRVAVRVAEGSVTVMPIVRFRTVTPEEYFEGYLAAQPATPDPLATTTTDPAASGADDGGVAAPLAAPSPPGVSQ